ncbi:PQQ-like beta-propeller repeat protein [Temperatibacter marinus]|uniref:PQQ-like beta-propeller repeat protein n=1 Tax=Temperatibacter marinus TaxID=1456591 RepID=A0AA52EBB3_9PROT|nr:PQQ-binding-like beta-propeller repeat protein [Temperatibacter marinus]WND02192.1 PQQ-like beta-propeller repeat protein [Temperatibacter marinus]
MIKTTKLITLTAIALCISACSLFEGGKKKVKYDDGGKERISILTNVTVLEADSSIASVPVVLPIPYRNKNWAQSGGSQSHAVHHLETADSLSRAWSVSNGAGNSKYERVISTPVSAEGKVFSVDAKGTVNAFSLSNGRKLWSHDIKIDENVKMGYGGGVAYDNGTVYATSGFGLIVALDASSGRREWTYKYSVPLRGAPTVAEGKVFAISHDNLMVAVDAKSGNFLWDQVGIMESAGMLGAASAAYEDGALVFALSSGELIARRATNGLVLWQDTLRSSRRLTPLATLTDIDANPVIDRGKVYGLSHSGRMVAIDMRSGERSWEADIAGVNTPWIAGNFAYVVTVDSQVLCISLADGRIRWVEQLQRFEDQEKRRDLIKWNGPLLAGNRLFLTSSHGYMLTLSPYTGDVLSGVNVGSGMTTNPIMVDGTLITLTDDGKLIAYR